MTVTQLASCVQTVACPSHQRHRPTTTTTTTKATTTTTTAAATASWCCCSTNRYHPKGDDSGSTSGTCGPSNRSLQASGRQHIVGRPHELQSQSESAWNEKRTGSEAEEDRDRAPGNKLAPEEGEHQEQQQQQQASKPIRASGCRLGEQMPIRPIRNGPPLTNLAAASAATLASHRHKQQQQQRQRPRQNTSRIHQLLIPLASCALLIASTLITELSVATSPPEPPTEAAAATTATAAVAVDVDAVARHASHQLGPESRHLLLARSGEHRDHEQQQQQQPEPDRRRLLGPSRASISHGHNEDQTRQPQQLRRRRQLAASGLQQAGPSVGYNQRQHHYQQPDVLGPHSPGAMSGLAPVDQWHRKPLVEATGGRAMGRPANEPSPSASSNPWAQDSLLQSAASRQFVSYSRQATVAPQTVGHRQQQHQQLQLQPSAAYLAPTTPTLNRQLVAPGAYPSLAEQGYELSLRPTNALQLESLVQPPPSSSSAMADELNGVGHPSGDPSEVQVGDRQQHRGARFVGLGSGPLRLAHWLQANGHHHQQQLQHHLSNSESIQQPVFASNTSQQQHQVHEAREAGSGNSGWQQHHQADQPAQLEGHNNNNQESTQQQSEQQSSRAQQQQSDSSNNSADQQSSASKQQDASFGAGSDDKTIEPRGTKRRIFNRILKKAEWNHLFVELSKVFLRYFLDLALKDIIGKQSGFGSAGGGGLGDSSSSSGSSSSSSSSSSTSQKKLDAQSQLADLLREFVKTAISNLR